MGKGQELSAGVNWSRYIALGQPRLHRALSVRQERPARRRNLPPRLQQLSTTSATTAARRPIRRTARARRSASASRSPNSSASAPATRSSMTRSRSTRTLLQRSGPVDPDGPVRSRRTGLGPECDPLLAGRYLCDQLGHDA